MHILTTTFILMYAVYNARVFVYVTRLVEDVFTSCTIELAKL